MLTSLSGWARLALPAGIAVGLLCPWLAAIARPAVAPAVMALLVIGMLRSPWSSLRMHLRRPGLVAVMLLMITVLSPLAVAIVADAAGLSAELRNGLVLTAGAPAIMSGAALAPMLGLDGALALLLILASTLLSSVTLPLVAEITSAASDASFWRLLIRSTAILGTCVLLAACGRWLLGANAGERRAAELDGLAVCLLVLFSIGIMDGVPDLAIRRPEFLAQLIGAALALNLALQACCGLLFLGLGRRTAVTLAFVSGNRNSGLLLAVLPAPLDPAIPLFVAAVQFPIYVLPSLLWRFYRSAARQDAPAPP